MERKGALQGLKVADFSQWAMAPLICTYLGAYGAEVVKVDSEEDPLRMSGAFKDNKPGVNRSLIFIALNSNRKSIAINMARAEGQQLAKKIALWADVVVESFRAGFIEEWELGYAALSREKPEIVMVRATIEGQTGPRSKGVGFGITLKGESGFAHLCGWPDRRTSLPIAYNDFIVPPIGVTAVMGALVQRQLTGKGQLIDLSAYEASLPYLTPVLLDYEVNKNVQTRQGNRSPIAAPHGAYRCRGEDSWCAIAVCDDEEWGALRGVMGNPEWAYEARFATLSARKVNEEELDRLLESWTINFTPVELMEKLQQAGVPAGAVQNSRDLLDEDPQLKHRGFFPRLKHAEVGECYNLGWPAQLVKTPAQLEVAPCLGQDNYYVCHELLSMPDEEIVFLINEGILQT